MEVSFWIITSGIETEERVLLCYHYRVHLASGALLGNGAELSFGDWKHILLDDFDECSL